MISSIPIAVLNSLPHALRSSTEIAGREPSSCGRKNDACYLEVGLKGGSETETDWILLESTASTIRISNVVPAGTVTMFC